MLDFIFYMAAFFLVLSALNVVCNPNPVYAGLGLVGGFFMLGIIYILMQAEFFGVIQIMVYAGAILVLFLFIIMLLNLSKVDRVKVNFTTVFVSSITVFLLLFKTMALITLHLNTVPGFMDTAAFPAATAGIKPFAKVLFTEYLPVIYFAGLMLIVAIVGAVVLTKKKYTPQPIKE